VSSVSVSSIHHGRLTVRRPPRGLRLGGCDGVASPTSPPSAPARALPLHCRRPRRRPDRRPSSATSRRDSASADRRRHDDRPHRRKTSTRNGTEVGWTPFAGMTGSGSWGLRLRTSALGAPSRSAVRRRRRAATVACGVGASTTGRVYTAVPGAPLLDRSVPVLRTTPGRAGRRAVARGRSDVRVFAESTHAARRPAVGAELGQTSSRSSCPDGEGGPHTYVCLTRARTMSTWSARGRRRRAGDPCASAREGSRFNYFTIGGSTARARPAGARRGPTGPTRDRLGCGRAPPQSSGPACDAAGARDAVVAPITEEATRGPPGRRARRRPRTPTAERLTADDCRRDEPGSDDPASSVRSGGTAGRAAGVFPRRSRTLVDLGELAGPDPDALCRAEVRAETPGGPWTVRLASRVHDEPRPLLWDSTGLLILTYGFHAYAFEPRTGALRWTRRSGTPFVAVLGSSRLDHVLLQSEVETFGSPGWRHRLAGRAGCRHRGRADRRPTRPHELRRGGHGHRPGDRAIRRLSVVLRTARCAWCVGAPLCGRPVDNSGLPRRGGHKTVDNAIDRRAAPD
jgi:hypothetical protein